MADETFSVRVPVNVSPEMALWLEEMARGEDRSVASFVRRLVREEMARGVVRLDHPSVSGPRSFPVSPGSPVAKPKEREVRTFLKGVK